MFSWGANLCFQLGHGDWNPRYQPQLVDQLPGRVRTASTSTFHTLAVLQDNRLFGWGQNKEGQLGRNKTDSERTIPAPKEIPHDIPEPIVRVDCGLNHALLLGESGQVYAFGNNALSQLGKEVLFASALQKPLRVDALAGVRVVDILAKSYFSFATTDTGQLWGWGYSSDYQFGITREAQWSVPHLIAEAGPLLRMKNISSGGYHHYIHLQKDLPHAGTRNSL